MICQISAFYHLDPFYLINTYNEDQLITMQLNMIKIKYKDATGKEIDLRNPDQKFYDLQSEKENIKERLAKIGKKR